MSAAPKKAKTGTTYEVVTDETGAMRRVPVQRPAPALLPLAPNRTAIVSAAVSGTAPKPPSPVVQEVVEEELVFGNEPEPLTGEARAAALAQAQPQVQAQPKPDEEEELVFGEEAEPLTGNARARELAAMEARIAAAEAAEAARKPKPSKRSRVTAKFTKTFGELNGIEKMKFVYRLRAKFPFFYPYTAEGNLEIKADNPSLLPAEVVPLRAFSALRPEELEEIETKQKQLQSIVENQYVMKMKELRELNDAYRPGDEESALRILKANEELRELSVLRNQSMFPERWTRVLSNPSTNIILLEEKQEERKLGYDVYMFKRFFLSKQDALGHYREHGEANGEGMAGGGSIVLFLTSPDDETTGCFHPAAEREFVYNETKYVSPYQAFETERFKELDDEKMVKQLLGTRSAKTIKQLVAKEPQNVKHPQQVWENILEVFYSQFKDAADKLKATGSARFHMMDTQIGTPEYANALSNVRTKMKEKESEAPSSVGVIKQSVISEDEQKKAKVGAIIHNMRR